MAGVPYQQVIYRISFEDIYSYLKTLCLVQTTYKFKLITCYLIFRYISAVSSKRYLAVKILDRPDRFFNSLLFRQAATCSSATDILFLGFPYPCHIKNAPFVVMAC